MSHKKWLGAALAALLVGSSFMVAQAAKTTGSTTRPAKLTKPWSEIKDLSDDQVVKIKEIHEKFLQQQHELESKEKADIMALLNDAQKKELDEVRVEEKKAAAERAAERRTGTAAKGATTKPASGK